MLKLKSIFLTIYIYLYFFFLLDFVLSQLTSLQFILYYVTGFYKPTVLKVPTLPFAGYATMPGKSFSQILFQALIQMNGS
jgi:hypothetical protein